MANPEQEAKAERLSQVPVFRTLTRTELLLVASIASEEQIPAGGSVVRGGDLAQGVFVLLDGELRAPAADAAAVEQRFAPGVTFGISALVEPLRYRRDVIAVTDVVGMRIPTDGLLSLMDADDSIGKRMWREVARELRGRVTALLDNVPHAGGHPGQADTERLGA